MAVKNQGVPPVSSAKTNMPPIATSQSPKAIRTAIATRTVPTSGTPDTNWYPSILPWARLE